MRREPLHEEKLKKNNNKNEEWEVVKRVIWNINGLSRKGKFANEWEYLQKHEVIILTETWIKEKSAERLKQSLAEEYEWSILNARRDKPRERDSGGMLIGVRKELRVEVVFGVYQKAEVATVKIKGRKEKWIVMGVYIKEDLEKVWNYMDKEI